MFQRAAQANPVAPKPLRPNPSRANATPIGSMTATAGEKRKLDAVQGHYSGSLAAIHSNFPEFGEDDLLSDNELNFDDNELNFDDILEISTPIKQNETPAIPAPENLPPTPPPPPKPSVAAQDAAPPSSVPLPWSSSPRSHFDLPAKPVKRRHMPWDNKDAQEKRESAPHRTPQTKQTPYPWNKTMSAVKEEQKELRKLQRTRSTTEKGVHRPVSKVPSIFLSDEQKHILEVIVKQGKSVFFTGSAGTGKSVLMRELIRQLKTKYKKEADRVAVTASTGLAACNIGGVTLHSFAGVGLGKEDAASLVKKVKRNQKARNRWLRTKVLVIDEISMVDGDFFDKLEELARKIRNNGRPFGGIQLVVTGDFFQLPPVPESGRDAKFSFAANTWATSIQHTILLTHVFRQKDPEFAGMLNEMRLGKLSQESADTFRGLSRNLSFDDSLEATELFPTRTEVENANSLRMSRLSGDVMVFNAIDSGSIQDVQFRDRLLANCMAPPTMQLKKGAQVMLIKNMDETLVNGSLGKVVAFMDESTFDYYIRNEDEFHDGPENDDPASRARKKIKGLAYDPKNGPLNTSRKWPLVSFVLPDGTERHLLCRPEAWKVELPNGEVQAQRQQVPLILAWALSIHKAQGQTLQRVKVDLGRVFEKGQAYVALSRATSQEGLQVLRFDPRKVMVHHKVLEFYSNLSSAKEVIEAKTIKDSTKESSKETTELDSDLEAEFFGMEHM